MSMENTTHDPVRELMAADNCTKIEAMAALAAQKKAHMESAETEIKTNVEAPTQAGADVIPVDRKAIEDAQVRFGKFWERSMAAAPEGGTTEDRPFIGFMFDAFVAVTERGKKRLSSPPFTQGLPGEFSRERIDVLEELDAWTWRKTNNDKMPTIVGGLAVSDLAEDLAIAMEYVIAQESDQLTTAWTNESGGNGQLRNHIEEQRQLQQGQQGEK